MPVDEIDRLRGPNEDQIMEEDPEEIKEMMGRLSTDQPQHQTAKKFDIKQLKAEIWHIIENRLPVFG